MKNYYKELDRDTLLFLQKQIKQKIESNKARHKAHKAIEKELFLITAALMKATPVYDWQNRRDLQ